MTYAVAIFIGALVAVVYPVKNLPWFIHAPIVGIMGGAAAYIVVTVLMIVGVF